MVEEMVGAAPLREGGVAFRVWAPAHERVEVVLEAAGGTGPAGLDGRAGAREAREAPTPTLTHTLERGAGGWHEGVVSQAGPGTLYRYRLDGGSLVPDPGSRFQPDGPHGPSEVVDPSAYAWRDGEWRGRALADAVLYEMHVGTFSAEGTWRGAMRHLEALAEIGVTVLEVMPVAEFPGRFGWGYDGVCQFAPYRGYGRPDDMRAFVDRAHELGMGVVLDVVYNHMGPDGNYMGLLAPDFVHRERTTDWGEAINFDGAGSEHVRAFYRANVRHWIREYHLDGFRFDATQDIHDTSEPHILAELSQVARHAAADRSILLIAENEPQEVRLVKPLEAGGYGFDALWNDDVHHSVVAALTGQRGAYYIDYRGSAQELVSAAKHGFLYQGQRYEWQSARRGTPTRGVSPATTIGFIENHDQVSNAHGAERLRLRTHPGGYRAMLAYLLLSPSTPMLFQGQEFGSTSPFWFFADHADELAAAVRSGRADFLAQFPHLALPGARERVMDPADPATFERCRLSDEERERNVTWWALSRDLLTLRRERPAFRPARRERIDGAVLGPRCFVVRCAAEAADEERLLLVNLDADMLLSPAPEPLLAPPLHRQWRLEWTSEDPAYGGRGTPEPETEEGWRIPGYTTLVLKPVR